eukprot:391448-Rhodomonas_salina.2
MAQRAPPPTQQTVDMYNEFAAIFLTGANLQQFLIYTCNAAPAANNDPISNTVVSVLTSPLSISLSNVGVRAFKNTDLAPIPYYLLGPRQCAFIRRVVQKINDGELTSLASSNANGGFLLRIPPQSAHVFVDKPLVMQHLSKAILGCTGHGDTMTKQRVVDILKQRIGVLTVVPSSKSTV